MVGQRAHPALTADYPVVGLRASEFSTLESHAKFHPLGSIDAHHRSGKSGIEFAKHRATQSDRHTLDDAGHHSAYRVALGLDALYQPLHSLGSRCIRTSHSRRVDHRQVEQGVVAFKHDIAHLRSVGHNLDALRSQYLTCDSTTHHATSRLTSTRTPSAAMVANAILGSVGVVGMRRTIGIAKMLIVR